MAASDAEARVAAAAGLILDGYLANESGHESAVYVDDLGLPDHKPVLPLLALPQSIWANGFGEPK